ncbi:MAG TPA: thermonuclease family protein [Patescibacteria group bacterium]|nr:thermonuclease family protein [Patescibacteria group bacterium]
MNPPRRQMVVAMVALAVAMIATACAAAPATPGRPGGSPDPGTATPVPVPGAPERPTGPTQDATLVRVVDGDTIRVMVGGVEERVRYIGIDTPELRPTSPATPDPQGAAATDANTRLLAGGRIVLEMDVSERDRHGRLLRDVWVERAGAWTLVNLALVAEGYAQVATHPPNVRYVNVLLAAQRAARGEGRGLWGRSAP